MIYEFDGKTPVIDPTAFVSESATLIGDVIVSAECYIAPNVVIRGDLSQIVIGEQTAVEDGVIIHVGRKGCRIGKRVTLGHGAIIHGSSIADGANIGMGAILSLSSVVGEYAVVAEGAVVKQGQFVEPKTVVGGMPAKVLRTLEEKDILLWEKSKDIYVDLAKQCLNGKLKLL